MENEDRRVEVIVKGKKNSTYLQILRMSLSVRSWDEDCRPSLHALLQILPLRFAL
jgi:hypothetical protein